MHKRGGFADLYRDVSFTSPSEYFFAFLLDEGHRPMAFDVFFTPFQLMFTPGPDNHKPPRATGPTARKTWTSDEGDGVCKPGWEC